MNPNKRFVLFTTGLCLLAAIMLTLTTVGILIVRPGQAAWLTGFIALCFAAASVPGILKCRHSDRWFEEEEHRHAEWYARHPRLTAALTVLSFAVILRTLFKNIFL